MQSVLKNISNDQLRAYFVWLPVMRSDDREAALQRSKEFRDSRLAHYWDGEQLTGKAWDPVLKTGQIAWDVYLIFTPSAKWDKEPPAPVFWMHQLQRIAHAPRLDTQTFENRLRELLKRPD